MNRITAALRYLFGARTQPEPETDTVPDAAAPVDATPLEETLTLSVTDFGEERFTVLMPLRAATVHTRSRTYQLKRGQRARTTPSVAAALVEAGAAHIIPFLEQS